ncbi:MAG: formate dehydrogenase, partial [bacterium]|nr:formate dehydrogenase [bacterium]
MARFASLEVIEGLNHALGNLVKGLLEKDIVQAVMVPCRQTHGNIVKQAVVADPGEAGEVDPLAPIVPVSSAVLLAKLTRKEAGVRVAAFLRPCEVRAYVELVKLKQASLEN